MMGKKSLYLSPSQVEKKFKDARLGLKETLSLIEMTWEDPPRSSVLKPSSRLFNPLDRLSRSTVRGSRIQRFRPNGPNQPFQVFEVYTQEKEVLAYLNLLYLRKPLPCYYLVYVEVTPSLRGKGLGNRILEAFRDLVEEKGALGLLDNIIPPEDPTFDIYTKLGWISLDNLIGSDEGLDQGHYMIYLPTSLKTKSFKLKLSQLIFNLEKKRPVIEMQDNELMVQRTIREFNDLHSALKRLFKKELESGNSSPLMRFMFTKFTTRLLGFQRRIQELLGYTGGESLKQITLSSHICSLPIQPFNFVPEGNDFKLFGDPSLWTSLPPAIKANPTLAIERLPLYQRPYLKQWMKEKGCSEPLRLTIADLLELGFDPTRLRELALPDRVFMFERISPVLLEEIEKRKDLVHKIERKTREIRIQQAQVKINPPLLWIHDRGNGYILRRKTEGIHWEEAIYQLKQNPDLRFLNQHLLLDQKLTKIIGETMNWIKAHIRVPDPSIIQDLAYFVPWNLGKNRPLFSIDNANVPYLEKIWVA
ncbi:MAG: GNAT family N-acetyltransferase [Thermodesulfobacteriota bacterium]